MANYKVEHIRNVILAGHGGAGKTTLVDELLYEAGATNRKGSVDDETSLSDTADDEKEGRASIDLSILYCDYDGKHIQLFDTPGRSDFIAQYISALHAAENVVICIDAYSGIQVNTKRVWKMAKEHDKQIFFVVTKLDSENVELEKVLENIREVFGKNCVPFYLPDATGAGLSKLYSVLDPPDDAPELVNKYHDPLVETVVEIDDELMEMYLEGEDISQQLIKAIPKAIDQGTIVPIFCYAKKGSLGVKELLNAIAAFGASPARVNSVKVMIKKETEEDVEYVEETRSLDSNKLVAQVFKTVVDEHKGKMALARVYSGKAMAGTNFYNPTKGQNGKFGKFFKFFGATQEEIQSAGAGEIFAVAKTEELDVSDTITDGGWREPLTQIKFPTPMVALAIKPKSRSDEQRISAVLQRYVTEDPTFRAEVDRQTKEMVIYGLSDLHLHVLLKRMADRHGVQVDTKLPKISYRETITAGVEEAYRHKKQSGGAGEFAEVHLRVRPYPKKDKDLNFIDALRGMNVRRQFVPSVEKGVKTIMAEGILTGSPVIWVEVEFFDGKDHPVDGKDVAFQKAARECFKRAFLKANPVLLEPMVNLEVTFPQEFAGQVSQYLNSHRGKLSGMESLGEEQTIRCTIPFAEIQTFSSDLRSITQGQGSYTIEFAGYEEVPPHIQKIVVEKYQKQKAKEEEA